MRQVQRYWLSCTVTLHALQYAECLNSTKPLTTSFFPSLDLHVDGPSGFLFFSLHSHITSVLGDVMAGWGFEVKELWWSWECGKPSSVQSNHSRPSIILPLWYLHSNLSQPITSQSCLSPLFHYSQLTSQKIRVTLGSPPTSPSTFPLSISHPLLPVHWLVYGGWH